MINVMSVIKKNIYPVPMSPYVVALEKLKNHISIVTPVNKISNKSI